MSKIFAVGCGVELYSVNGTEKRLGNRPYHNLFSLYAFGRNDFAATALTLIDAVYVVVLAKRAVALKFAR